MSPARMILFVDAKNFLEGARTAFFGGASHSDEGYIDPQSLGQLLCRRYAPGPARELVDVRVYVEPPGGEGAFEASRIDAWRRSGVVVIHPADTEDESVIETLAKDFQRLAVSESCEVGVIASSDMRLVPAIANVLERNPGSCRPEVVAWKVARSRASRPLRIGGKRVYCHWLMRSDYDEVADSSDHSATA